MFRATSRTTRCSPRTCWTRRAAATRLRELCEDRGLAAAQGPPADAQLIRALTDLQRPSSPSADSTSAARCRAAARRACCATWRSPGSASTSSCSARSADASREEVAQLEQSIYKAAGEEFVIGSPQQLGAILFEQARPVAQAPRQDRLLDRRPRPRGDPRRAPDRGDDRALARAVDADQDLPRAAARPGRRDSRGCTRRSCRRSRAPDGSRRPTRTCRTCRSARRSGARSAPASSPRPGRLLVCADYSQIELRVLAQLADEPVLKEIFRARRGRPHGDRLPGLRRRAERARRRDALEGEDDQLRHRLRADRLRPRRPPADPARGGCGVHRDLLRALPRGARVHRSDDRTGDRAGLRDDAARTPPADPRAASPQSPAARARRAPRGEHRDPGDRRRHNQGRDGALPRRARRPALTADPPDPR